MKTAVELNNEQDKLSQLKHQSDRQTALDWIEKNIEPALERHIERCKAKSMIFSPPKNASVFETVKEILKEKGFRILIESYLNGSPTEYFLSWKHVIKR